MVDIVLISKHKEYERQTKRSAAGCLKDCRARNPTEVFVVGVEPNGDIFVHGSPPDPGNALWLMEMAKRKLLGY